MKKRFFFLSALVVLSSFLWGEEWAPSVLRPGDVLDVTVFRVAEFSKSVRVDEDGTFSYPMCGVIRAAGRTARAVGQEIQEKLVSQITNPYVDIQVQVWAPRTVYVLGEVQGSSAVQLPNYTKMTALQAISSCGGFSSSADLNGVYVLRRNPKNENELMRLKVDVSALVSKDNSSDDFILHPDDTLIIPKAPPVYVCGEVTSPTSVYIDTQRPPLCSELLLRCGGMKNGADVSNILIVRGNQGAERKVVPVSLRSTELGKYDNDVRIEPGDSVFVGIADEIFVLGEVTSPGPLVLAPNKVVTASQAIALAGGFTSVAKQSEILLIRNKEMLKVNLKKLYNKVENMERDIELKNGDILFVQESLW